MGPGVFGRKNHQSDQDEQHALQNGQKQAGNPQKQENPTNYDNGNSLELLGHGQSVLQLDWMQATNRLIDDKQFLWQRKLLKMRTWLEAGQVGLQELDEGLVELLGSFFVRQVPDSGEHR
jgi:hypothetical protein